MKDARSEGSGSSDDEDDEEESEDQKSDEQESEDELDELSPPVPLQTSSDGRKSPHKLREQLLRGIRTAADSELLEIPSVENKWSSSSLSSDEFRIRCVDLLSITLDSLHLASLTLPSLSLVLEPPRGSVASK